MIIFLIVGILCYILTPALADSFAKNWGMYWLIMGVGALVFYVCVGILYFSLLKKRGR